MEIFRILRWRFLRSKGSSEMGRDRRRSGRISSSIRDMSKVLKRGFESSYY